MDFELYVARAEFELPVNPERAMADLASVPESYRDDWPFLYLRAQARAATDDMVAAATDAQRSKMIAGERWLPSDDDSTGCPVGYSRCAGISYGILML